jgi:hypothetical protein
MIRKDQTKIERVTYNLKISDMVAQVATRLAATILGFVAEEEIAGP